MQNNRGQIAEGFGLFPLISGLVNLTSALHS